MPGSGRLSGRMAARVFAVSVGLLGDTGNGNRPMRSIVSGTFQDITDRVFKNIDTNTILTANSGHGPHSLHSTYVNKVSFAPIQPRT